LELVQFGNIAPTTYVSVLNYIKYTDIPLYTFYEIFFKSSAVTQATLSASYLVWTRRL